jgi:hypothetical protein
VRQFQYDFTARTAPSTPFIVSGPLLLPTNTQHHAPALSPIINNNNNLSPHLTSPHLLSTTTTTTTTTLLTPHSTSLHLTSLHLTSLQYVSTSTITILCTLN